MRFRRAWLPAVGIFALLAVLALGVAANALLWEHSSTLSLESHLMPWSEAMATCPGGMGSLQLSPEVTGESAPREPGSRTLVEGRAYAAGPDDGPVLSWSVAPALGGSLAPREAWSTWLYRAPAMEPVPLRGVSASAQYLEGGLLRSLRHSVHLFPADAEPGQHYIVLLKRNEACGLAAFIT